MPKIKAIIFDMDGVLIDARDWHFEALNKALSLFGMEISRYDHLVTYDGLPTRKKLEMLTLERGLPEGLHPFLNELKQRYTFELIHARCRPNFIHEYALSQLKERGYRLAVCSNSIRATIELMMNRASLAQYPECILSNEDVKKPKPDPEIYETAISAMKLSPAECVVVEDNQNGIQAAKAAGAHVLEVTGVDDVTLHNITQFIGKVDAL
ncbi:MAG: HAD family hydrolase [Elusimicrobia bacterium CG1_02_63_36]|nr:MAG: HAD family hydrolase [Elusimicrobia bacterium CG1_02_63_36]PIP84089.1 MAG: HAD family hydrolase [Elusimicrobia bacterium CG22_combo_CG10-13_8_21_14_all_63_91]PJA15098.1 MAG: HAD family hydrolase [Elusimicrobia bacterium CG_4_10_14_0_2_um_filter_63_34]PJB23506.1 MAG: HAD family hydrolase [Elusimicrobia bacterium CG_4_9_14_3_um_filter_62_55]